MPTGSNRCAVDLICACEDQGRSVERVQRCVKISRMEICQKIEFFGGGAVKSSKRV